MDNWKWMQFWTDIAEGISHYRTQINGTKQGLETLAIYYVHR